MGPNAMTGVLMKGDIWSRHRPGQGGHVMTEAERGGRGVPRMARKQQKQGKWQAQIPPGDISGLSALPAPRPRETEVCSPQPLSWGLSWNPWETHRACRELMQGSHDLSHPSCPSHQKGGKINPTSDTRNRLWDKQVF